MTCYMRHMDWLFDELTLPNDKHNRQLMDGALRRVLELGPEAHCPEVWNSIKRLSAEDRAALVPQVADACQTMREGKI